ncbi:hypothetical protein BKA65DRAFT_389855 [Rhexocercosporidium sp. MPI-PUGE-AT-0058]|nr:hypothetical protein BKA65DRAFT_389855 [Rhexocercosporidium sp. MPI-PUGE-AT-0058]
MPNFNIHWKGYPHHRLPRIRVVSARRNSVQSRSLPTSRQNSRIHSKIKNEKENKKQPFKIQFRRRRVRGSRASSSVVRTRRRASLRARHNIQVFGWDTPGAELASKVTTEETGPGYRTPSPRSRSGATLRPEPQDNSIIPSTDGTASSVARRPNLPKKKSENAYSLRHIAKVPVYWTADHPSKRENSAFNPDRLYSAQRAEPLQAASNRISSHRPTEGSRTYDTRIDPLSPIASQRRRTSVRPQIKHNTFRKAATQVSPTRKDTGLGSPEFWEAVRDYSQQSKARGKSTPSLKSVVQSLLSETASRSPSQRKVLARFTKGIELYLQVAKGHPSQSLVSSISSRSVSAYTIEELKPYRSEFQSAGLAVTSAEQKGMAKLQKGLTPPPTPPKDDNHEKNRMLPMKKNNDSQKSAQKGKLPSYASGSTGTTVLGWTPPHEKTYGRQPPMVQSKRPSASTDNTVIGFTPPHEMYASPPRPARDAPAPPQAATKKSLPWLRRPDISPDPSPTKKVSVASVKPEQHRPSTPLGGWESMPIRSKSSCVDMGTQTVGFGTGVSRRDTIHDDQIENEPDIDRAPVPSSRSTTFPLKSNNCKGDCVQPPVEPLPSAPQQRSSRPSRVIWKGVDQETQAIIEAEPQDKPEPVSFPQQPSFQSNVVPGERTRTFSVATSPTKRIRPYQPPPTFRSPNKSIDEGISKWVPNNDSPHEPAFVPTEPRSLASPHRHSPPPLCTQCTGPLNPEPESKLEQVPKSDMQPSTHACTARSSTQYCLTPERKRKQSKAEQNPGDTNKSYHSPERKRTQSKAELAIEEYTKQEPMADPMKRPSLLGLKPKLVKPDHPRHFHCYSTVSRPKTLPQMPKIPVNVSVPIPTLTSTVSNDSCSLKSSEVNDKQVFKGLHIATAAACDEDVDKWIEEITGASARKFLSKLSAFDGLGVNTLAGVARRAAKQRREKLNVWEAVREQRVAKQDQMPICKVEDFVEVEYMVGDQDVRLRSECSETSGSGTNCGDDEYVVYDQGVRKERVDLTTSMLKRRE